MEIQEREENADLVVAKEKVENLEHLVIGGTVEIQENLVSLERSDKEEKEEHQVTEEHLEDPEIPDIGGIEENLEHLVIAETEEKLEILDILKKIVSYFVLVITNRYICVV